MSKKILKCISLMLAIFMMIVSLGACKKDKKAASGNKNGTKTAMTTKRTVTAKKSTTSVSKTNKNANNETAKNSKTGASS